MKALKGHVAVVTGAASGIGLAMANRFAREGMNLVLADIEDAPLQKAAQQLKEMGCELITLNTDVRFENQVQAPCGLMPGTPVSPIGSGP